MAVRTADLRVKAATNLTVIAILDVSLGGVRLEVAEPAESLKVGLLVDIDLEWQGKSQIFNGVVRHAEHHPTPTDPRGRLEVGLEFDDPDLVESLLGPWYDEEVTKL